MGIRNIGALMDVKSVWIVFSFNVGPYVIGIYETETEALRVINDLGYGSVKEYPLGSLFDNVIN